MSFHPNAFFKKQKENAADLKEKKISFESAMVNVGLLVTYLCSSAVKKTLTAVCNSAVRTKDSLISLRSKAAGVFKEKTKKSEAALSAFGKKLLKTKEIFEGRKAESGFFKAVGLQLSDFAAAIKNNKNFTRTVVNYTVPVVCVALLICVVSDKTSADYGVSVEYNGQEIGVVSEQSVIDEAQKVVADRATYYDADSDTYITATLALKPLGSNEEVIDEQMLADAIQEQIDTQAVDADVINAESEIETAIAQEAAEAHNDGRIRAFPVMVDGEFLGAVTEYDRIENFLETTKKRYSTEDTLSVSFDKNIEYSYESYVLPDQIVDQQQIINIFSSVVSEPVYYQVELGDSPWQVAVDNDMSLDELTNCFATFEGEQIGDITEYFPVGAMIQLSAEVPYLQIMTTKQVEYTEAIDYEIIKTEDPDMYKGDTAVDVKGVEGEKLVKAIVTYKGDVAVATEVLSEVVISEPVAKQMRVGTRKTSTPLSTDSGGSGVYFWPVGGGYISSYQGDGRGHKGIDIAAPYGTPIYAAESGTVIVSSTGWNGGYGNWIKIEHGDGNVTIYAHQSSLAVSYGEYVVKGQLIGYVGSTGDSSGNHLHFEVRSNGAYLNPIDYVSQY